MNLAISNIAWLYEQRHEVYTLMQQYGYTGLEIAPALFQGVSEQPYSQPQHVVDAALAELSDYDLKLVSMQALHFGETGMALFETAAQREKLLSFTKQAIDFAGRLGIPNLVFGSPKLRNIPEGMSPSQVDDIALPFFQELARHAQDCSCVIGLEPNAADYGTNFMNTTEQVLGLLREVNHLGLRLNLDMGNLIANETPLSVLTDAGPWISHTHFSLPMLRTIEAVDVDSLSRFAQHLLPHVSETSYFSIEMGRSDLEKIECSLRALEERC